uniref:J domain-containing protein n=1 Tax=Zooxanthella nutricula TaxID=1333877 RepID=A0A7S2M3J1_9DINO
MADGERPRTLYDVLGVQEDAQAEDLTKAYRHKALEQHPDKGGDKDAFDELAKAFKTLDCAESRDAYDAELARARERDALVEGGPSAGAGAFSEKQAQAPMPRAKTEPTAGSKRQGKLRASQPGNAGMCAQEWKGMSSGAHILKMLCDEATEEQKTEALFTKYAALPRGKDKKRQWLSSVRGQQKQDLKALAKKKEAEQMEKWSKWLNR